ncbi:MAG: amidohydrolase family protein [Verrucomicrobiota bacterium]
MIRQPIAAVEIAHQVQAARGQRPVDLLLRNCQLINVYSNDIHTGDLAIVGGRIVAIRDAFLGRATNILEAEECFVAPALVDSSFAESIGFDERALPRGTGSILGAGDVSGQTLRDHEIVTTFDEARRSVREGKTAFLDERIGAAPMTSLLAEIRHAGIDCSHICFAVDPQKPLSGDEHPIRLAVRGGFSVPEAFQMGALNPAAHFGLDDVIGSLVPARRADILLFDRLDDFRPARMILQGWEVLPP